VLGYALIVCAGLLTLAALLCEQRLARPMLLMMALAMIVASWTIHRAGWALAERISAEQEGVDYRVEGRITGLPQSLDQGVRFDFTIDDCVGQSNPCPTGRTVRLSWQRTFGRPFMLEPVLEPASAASEADGRAPPLSAGEQWRLLVRLRRPHATVNPGLFDAELRLLQEGIAALGYVRSARGDPELNRRIGRQTVGAMDEIAAFRDRVRQALRKVMESASPDLSALVLALAVGDQAALSADAWEVFNRTGVAHLMSISGLHITMLAGLALALSRRVLRLPNPLVFALLQRCDAARLSWGFALLTAFAYSLLAGWGIPAQRTCWMLAACAWALNSGRCRRMRDILLFAAAVVTVLDPWAPLSAGFWLSFFAVGSIVWHASAHHARTGLPPSAAGPGLLASWPQRCRKMLSEAASSQWAVTIALLPLGAWFFSSVSVIGPLANAMAIPVVSLVITPAAILMAVLAFVWPVGAQWLALPLDPLVNGLMDLLRTLASPGWAALVLGSPSLIGLALSSLAALVIIAPFHWPGRLLVLPAIVALVFRPAELPQVGTVRMTVLDIGQGMAVLIETAEGRLLYDTGPAFGPANDAGRRVLVPYLRARGISRLDALVVSHADIDHAGGAASLLKSIDVSRLISSLEPTHRLLTGHPQHASCRAGDHWVWSGVRFEILHPHPEGLTSSGRRPSSNSRSCVLRVSSDAGSILLTGDIEAREERMLLAGGNSARLKAEILLAPHHGSATSSSAAFVQAVSPQWVIAQVGYRNRFRHPAEVVVRRYENAGATLLRTDHTGAIHIILSPGSPPRVNLARGSGAPYWRLKPAY
jgi:competence protein ComEC